MENVKAINDDRFSRWKTQLNRKNATPQLLIGLGHDHNAGIVTLITAEELTEEQAVLFLTNTIVTLQEQINKKKQINGHGNH